MVLADVIAQDAHHAFGNFIHDGIDDAWIAKRTDLLGRSNQFLDGRFEGLDILQPPAFQPS